MKTLPWLTLLLLAGLLFGAWLSNYRTQDEILLADADTGSPTIGSPTTGSPATGSPTKVLAQPRTLTPFQLTFQNNTELNLQALQGKWTFIFFGYTHCPDVCPTTLAELAHAHELLQQDAHVLDNTQFIFVSVDPERDTLELLQGYTAYFDKDFIGATGNAEQIKTLAKQLGVRYSRGDQSDAGYVVNHSSAIMLIDPQARFYARLNAPHYAEDLRRHFLTIRQHYAQSAPQS